jgi:hypothetical protein
MIVLAWPEDDLKCIVSKFSIKFGFSANIRHFVDGTARNTSRKVRRQSTLRRCPAKAWNSIASAPETTPIAVAKVRRENGIHFSQP